MQGGRVLLNFGDQFEHRNYEEDMQWFQLKKLFNDDDDHDDSEDEALDYLFHTTTTATTDLCEQALLSWGLSEKFGSYKSTSILADRDVKPLSNHGSAGFLGVLVFTVKKCLSEAPRFGYKSPGQALTISQVLEAIGRCYPAGCPLGVHFIVAADASPQRSKSSSESSSSSDSSFFIIRSPRPEHLEPGGVVEDYETGEEVDVGEKDGENSTELAPLRIPIIERNVDGTEHTLVEMALTDCFGYFTFAAELAGFYQGNQSMSLIPHVLWPWSGYSTHYMAQHSMDLDPRRMAWGQFSTRLRHIVVQSRPVSDTNVLPIQFQNHGGSITASGIPWRCITNLKSFVITVHMLWSGWRNVEPLDPRRVTDGNMVGLYFIYFFDAGGEELDIPTILSIGPLDKSALGDEDWDDEEWEDDDNDDDQDDGEVENGNDKQDRNEEDDKRVDEFNDVNDGDEAEDDSVKDFLQKLASIVVSEGRH